MSMRFSGTDQANVQIADWTDKYEAKGNLEFFGDALAAVTKDGAANGGLMAIGLLGQRDLPGVTLRWAQSVLRWDLRPSLWSHVFLFNDRPKLDPDELARAPLLEVPLHARTGLFPRPERNAVEEGNLGLYRDRDVDANAALLVIQMTENEAEQVADRARNPNLDRLRYNLWETLGVWETYLWSVGVRPNPLREGFPICASAFVEYAYEAIRLDLSPGASERNSAPEHLWAAAKWWHPTFAEFQHPISGYFVKRDPGCAVLDTEDIAKKQAAVAES